MTNFIQSTIRKAANLKTITVAEEIEAVNNTTLIEVNPDARTVTFSSSKRPHFFEKLAKELDCSCTMTSKGLDSDGMEFYSYVMKA